MRLTFELGGSVIQVSFLWIALSHTAEVTHKGLIPREKEGTLAFVKMGCCSCLSFASELDYVHKPI